MFVLEVFLDFVCKAKKVRRAIARVVHRQSKYLTIARFSLPIASKELESRQTMFKLKEPELHRSSRTILKTVSLLLSPIKQTCSVAIPKKLTLEDKKIQRTECLEKTGLNLSMFSVETAPSKQSQNYFNSQKDRNCFPVKSGRGGGGGGYFIYNGLYWEGALKRGTFLRLQKYYKVGIFGVEVNERVGKSVI